MGGAPFGDVTILYHGLFALFVPLGWALILYPYWRGHRGQWYQTLVFVAVLSFSFMVAKEIFLDTEISSDDIAADLLGLFFGTGFVSLFLYLERAIGGWRKKADGNDTVVPQNDADTHNHSTTGPSLQEISLRDIMGVLAKIHTRGSLLFEEAARSSTQESVKEICNRLASEKRIHAREVSSLLKRWSYKTPDVTVLDWMDERIGRYGIFSSPVPRDASDRELIAYAVEQERNIYTLFSSLHDHFRGYSWRTVQYENMILELKGHGMRFDEFYPKEEKGIVDNRPAKAKNPGEKQVAEPGREKANGLDAAVLVVDDEEGIRTAVAEYLKGDGFLHVDTASDGQEALDYCEKRSYDVVIVDIAMPKRHGLEVLRKIKSLSPQTQVIIITGKAGKDSAIAALRLGALDYIEKPFDFEALSKSVSKGLSRRRLLEAKG
jgi:CheY-like chemotaxis protein